LARLTTHKRAGLFVAPLAAPSSVKGKGLPTRFGTSFQLFGKHRGESSAMRALMVIQGSNSIGLHHKARSKSDFPGLANVEAHNAVVIPDISPRVRED